MKRFFESYNKRGLRFYAVATRCPNINLGITFVPAANKLEALIITNKSYEVTEKGSKVLISYGSKTYNEIIAWYAEKGVDISITEVPFSSYIRINPKEGYDE
jgi:hypothetical protein